MASASTVFRDYVIDGNPSSGIWNPQKSDIRALFAGAFLNNPTSINANAPILPSYAGNSIVVTGGAPVTLTYNAPNTGYASTHANIIYNASTRRVVIDITSTGGGQVWVWPGNFALVSLLPTGAWYARANSPRYYFQGGYLYADVVYGSDLNDGLAPGVGGARQTITSGIRSFLADFDFAGNQATLLLAAGTYSESPTVAAYPVGLAEVFFIQGVAPGAVIWKPALNSNVCCTIADGGTVEMENITFDNTGGISGAVALQVHQTAIVDCLTGITFGTFVGGTHISFDRAGGNCNMNNSYTISGTANSHASLSGPGMLSIAGNSTINIPNTLSGMSEFFFCAGGAINMGGSINFTGLGAGTAQPGAQWNVSANGWISKAGNTIPGNAGFNSVISGGQVF